MENEAAVITQALAYAKGLFASDSSGHDFAHTFRVFCLSRYIAIREGGDRFVISLAALLHDVDDYKLFGDSGNAYPNAGKFLLSIDAPAHLTGQVLHIIGQVSFKGKDSVKPDSLEGQIVQDADRLDALGYIGIGRAFAYGGHKGNPIYDPNIPVALDMDWKEYKAHKGTTINHFREKLFLLGDLMNTKTAKEIAIYREQTMHEFVAGFMKEWAGNDDSFEPLWLKLGLTPHPEGGYFRETFRPQDNSYSSILFLLAKGQASHLHVLKEDELWYFQKGSPLDIVKIEAGKLSIAKLGLDPDEGESPQVLVKAGTIFGSVCRQGYSLVGCMVSPGFTYDHFRLVTAKDLKGLDEKDLALARPLLAKD